jgi:hypothetical protein
MAFLNTLPDYSYVEGESLVTDLLMTLAHHLTFQYMVASNPTPATIAGLQAPLRQFIMEKVLKGAEPSKENVETALVNIADDWFAQMVSNDDDDNISLSSCRSSVPAWPQSGTMWIMRRPCTASCLSSQWSWS